MANPTSSPAADAAAKGFSDVVDHLTMLDLVKGFNLSNSGVSHDGLNYGQGEKSAIVANVIQPTRDEGIV